MKDIHIIYPQIEILIHINHSGSGITQTITSIIHIQKKLYSINAIELTKH